MSYSILYAGFLMSNGLRHIMIASPQYKILSRCPNSEYRKWVDSEPGQYHFAEVPFASARLPLKRNPMAKFHGGMRLKSKPETDSNIGYHASVGPGRLGDACGLRT